MQSAHKLAAYLARELSLDVRQADRLRFGAEIVFSNILGFAAIIILAYLLDCLPEALTAAAACAAIRTFAGGAHCTTAWRCAFTTGVVFTAQGKAAGTLPLYLPGYEPVVILGASAMACYLIWRLAPVAAPENPIGEPLRRAWMKKRSLQAVGLVVTLMLVSLLLAAPPGLVLAAGFGLGWSALLLTSPVHRLLGLVDAVLGFGGQVLRRAVSQNG